MSITQLEDFANICMGVGIGLMIVAILLYIRLDIYKAWHMVVGKPMKESGRGHGRKKTARGESSQQSGTLRPMGEFKQSGESTVALTQKLAAPVFVEENTEVTRLLGTDELPREDKTLVLNASGENFRIIYEVTYIHADV